MTVTIEAKALEAFVADIFATAGCSKEEGGRIGRYLVSANLSGHDSHGVVRVPRYASQKKAGTVVADVTVDVLVDTPVIAVVDGKYGFGQTVTPQAIRDRHREMPKERPLGRDPAQCRARRPGRRLGRDGGGRGTGLGPFRQRVGQRARGALRRRRPAFLDRALLRGHSPRRSGSADPRLRHLDRGRRQGAGGEPGRQEDPGRRADRARTASPATTRTCSTATTRRPVRATTARAPAPSRRSATTRALASPSCARCWAARSRAPAPPIPRAASSPTACCRSTSTPRCSTRWASFPPTSRATWIS